MKHQSQFPLPQIERRITSSSVTLRGIDGIAASGKVRGYAAVFNHRSEVIHGADGFSFYEIILPGAFDGVLRDDVRALFNHNPDLILARTKSGTLRIGVDRIGLWYEFGAPATSVGKDLMEWLERGDVDQSSFAFQMPADLSGETWSREGKSVLRTIRKVSRLFDVSPVTYPAYPATDVSLQRLIDVVRTTGVLPGQEAERNADYEGRRLDLAEAEYQ